MSTVPSPQLTRSYSAGDYVVLGDGTAARVVTSVSGDLEVRHLLSPKHVLTAEEINEDGYAVVSSTVITGFSTDVAHYLMNNRPLTGDRRFQMSLINFIRGPLDGTRHFSPDHSAAVTAFNHVAGRYFTGADKAATAGRTVAYEVMFGQHMPEENQ